MTTPARSPPPREARLFTTRAWAALVVVLVTLIAVVAGSIYAIVLARSNAEAYRAGHGKDLIATTRLSTAFERKLASGRGFVLAGDDDSRRNYTAAAAEVDEALAVLHGRDLGEEGEALLLEAERAIRAHGDLLVRAMNLRETTSLEEAARYWTDQVLGRARAGRSALDALAAFVEREHVAGQERAAAADRTASIVVGAVCVGVLVLGGIVGPLLMRSARHRFADAERARRFLGRLLDQLPIGIIAAEAPSGRPIHVSASARQLLGDDRPVGDVRKRDGSAYESDRQPLARALRGQVVTGEEVVSSVGVPISATAAPIRDDQGDIAAAVLAFEDISERRRGEQERELFLGALGHDLRTPLSAIVLSAGTLASRPQLDESTRRIANRIVKSSERMLRLIQQLLDFTRSQHGAIPIHRAACNLQALAREVISSLELGSPGCEIRLVHDEEGSNGHWDHDRIAQVLQNLVGNAIEHGEKGTPIEVRLRPCGDEVCIEVANHGDPIPPELLPLVFEPFRQVEGKSGLGLGLYIARAIVHAHAGTIEVESRERLTTFRVTLPRDGSSPSAPSASTASPGPSPRPGS